MFRRIGPWLAIASLFAFPRLSLAYGPDSDQKSFYLGAGAISENMRQYGTDPGDDSTSWTATVYFNVRAAVDIPLSGGLFFEPSLGGTPFGIRSTDKGEIYRIFTLGLQMGYALGPISLRLGPGVFDKLDSVSGGSITESNGHGSSSFALPPEGRSQTLIDLDAGLDVNISDLRIGFDLLVMGAASTARRSTDGMVTASYGLF